MMRLRVVLVALLLSLLVSVPLLAQDDLPAIYVYNAWLVTEDGQNGTVYLSIENTLPVAVELVSVTTPHGHVMLAPMDADAVRIAPGETLLFTPDTVSLHVMGADDAPSLNDGLSLALTFTDADNLTYAVTAAALPAAAAPAPADIVALGGWARPTALDDAAAGDPAEVIGGAYLTLANRGAQADTLVSLSSPRVLAVELHETQMDGGIMRMRPLEALTLEPGGQHTLAPGGDHLMLIGLESHLLPGQVVPLTLTFESGTVLNVAIPVIDERDEALPQAEATESGHMMGHH